MKSQTAVSLASWTWSLAFLPLAFVLALTLLVSGCDDPSPEERFAERACSTILPRATEMLEIYDAVRHRRATPGPDALPSLLNPIHGGQAVATKLIAEIRALPVMDSDAGNKAAIHLEDVARLARDRLVTQERHIRRLPESPTLVQTIHALNDLEVALVQAAARLTAVDYGVTTYVPGLREAFAKADSCEQLAALDVD